MSAPTYNGPGFSGSNEALMTPGQVAALFHVDPKTVTRWAHAGRLGSLRTPGVLNDLWNRTSCPQP